MSSSSLQGKTAIVTGGSQGIGAGIVRKLASEGANVVFTYRSNPEDAAAIVREFDASPATVVAVRADLTDPQDVEALLSQASTQFGQIDVLVNNAGVFTFLPIEATEPSEVERLFATNVFALIFTTKAALGHLKDGGSIINIGSIVATAAPAYAIAYSSSKAAVGGVTKVLSKELAPRQITVNQIDPGSIRTEGAQKAGLTAEVEESLVAGIPLGRMGLPVDIANAVAFLASDEARWITGEILMVSGGAR